MHVILEYWIEPVNGMALYENDKRKGKKQTNSCTNKTFATKAGLLDHLSTSIYATKSCAHLSHHISYISQLHKKCMFFDKSNINSIICFGDFIYQSPAQLCEGEYID
jgi:hypothetical protein